MVSSVMPPAAKDARTTQNGRKKRAAVAGGF
jgi:hypothetical protein